MQRRRSRARRNPAIAEHDFDVIFTVKTVEKNWRNIPTSHLLRALEERVRYLRAHPADADEAFGHVGSH